MRKPLLSIIIPTRDRHHLLLRALESALGQTIEDLEVIVVDDASTQPVIVPKKPRLRLVRLHRSGGCAGARNAGTEAAVGRWITYLDDDDQILPHMAEVSLEALEQTILPAPVGVITGVEVVNTRGEVIEQRFPPAVRPKGSHFSLENLEPGKSYYTKQTLVVERQVISQIGGWDETFRSRAPTELFLRLNPVCSILGLPIITYRLHSHPGPRLSGNPKLRQESFHRLVSKHRSQFQAHPKMFASFIYEHARMSYQLGQKRAVIASLAWAMRLDPLYTLRRIGEGFRRLLLKET